MTSNFYHVLKLQLNFSQELFACESTYTNRHEYRHKFSQGRVFIRDDDDITQIVGPRECVY